MLKAYEFRIYPTKEQEQMFLKANGLCRLYWNTALARKQEAYENGEKWNMVQPRQFSQNANLKL